MPRPGPRPYVCERRAWHSDRHQPMRGSLIQEIFRVVNEVHSSATKKNKEWQVKLPVVVLKAEEIMYSKANSETEYMDLRTLWDRTNDAINTIIRCDESTETGELLQPCIEAALNLGCTPRRTLRSQRNCTPRCYLNQFTQEVENSVPGNLPTNSHCMGSYSGFMKPATMNVADMDSESPKHIVQNGNFTTNKLPFASDNGSLTSSQCLSIQTMYSVYPLYYGNHHRFEELQPGSGVFPKSITNAVETSRMGDTNNIFSSDVDYSEKMNQTYVRDTSNNPHESECDLSLRLGPLSVPCLNVENIRPREIEDTGSTSLERSKFCDHTPAIDNIDNPMNSSSIKCYVEGEHMNVDATMRKRKAAHNPPANQQFCSPPKFPFCHFTGRMKSAGS